MLQARLPSGAKSHTAGAQTFRDVGSGASDAGQTRSGACSVDDFCWALPDPQGNTLRDAWALSRSDVWVVGDYGTILHYDGMGWSRAKLETTAQLNAIWGSGATDLFLNRRDVLGLERVIEEPAIEGAVVADCSAERDVDVEAEGHESEFRIQNSECRQGLNSASTILHYWEPALPPLHFKSAFPSPRSPARSCARACPPERAGSDGLRDALLRIFQSVISSSTPPLGGSSR